MSVGGQLLQPTSYESMQFESIVVSNIARQSMSFSDADPSAESVELYISEVRAGNRGGKGVAIASRGGLFRGVALVRVEWIAAASALIASNLQPPPPAYTHDAQLDSRKARRKAGGRVTRLANCVSVEVLAKDVKKPFPVIIDRNVRIVLCSSRASEHPSTHTHTHTHTHLASPFTRAVV